MPQIPLTLLNSVIAVCQLSGDLFPDKSPSATKVATSVGLMNLVGETKVSSLLALSTMPTKRALCHSTHYIRASCIQTLSLRRRPHMWQICCVNVIWNSTILLFSQSLILQKHVMYSNILLHARSAVISMN